MRARIRSRNPEAKARIRLLPVTERLGAWPDSGDLFLMDYDGSRPGAVACGANTMQMNEVKLQNIKRSVLPVENLYDGFHTFVCKWTERDVVFSVDGTAANIQEDLFDSRFRTIRRDGLSTATVSIWRSRPRRPTARPYLKWSSRRDCPTDCFMIEILRYRE